MTARAAKTTTARPSPAQKRRERLQQAEQPQNAVTTVSDDVQSYVPHISRFDNYVGRSVAGVDFMVAFEHARTKHINVLIEGPTGSGKTSAVQAFAAKHGLPFYSISSSVGLDPSQLFGKFIPDPSTGGFKWIDGPVTTVVRKGGVLLLNEMNFIPERIATVLFSLLDMRREITLMDNQGEVVKAHPGLVVFGDMNPEYEGTRPLNKAFRNRFGMQLTWDYDTTVEAQLVKSPTLLKLAKQIRDAGAAGTFETPLSTNAMVEFESMRADLGFEFAIYNLVQHFADRERQAIKTVLQTHDRGLRDDYARLDAQANNSTKKSAPQQTTHDVTWGIDTADLTWAYDQAVKVA